MAKSLIRQEILRQRRQLEADRRDGWSRVIQAALMATPEYAAARTIALYSPVQNEVRTDRVAAAALQAGKVVAFPRVAGEDLRFLAISSLAELKPGRYGIPEPEGEISLPLAAIDLMAVPGVAFDPEGHRLGYGKGFYDRALHRDYGSIVLAGLAFDFQLVARLPAEVHDVRLNLVVTEKRTLRFAGQGVPGITSHHSQGGPRR